MYALTANRAEDTREEYESLKSIPCSGTRSLHLSHVLVAANLDAQSSVHSLQVQREELYGLTGCCDHLAQFQLCGGGFPFSRQTGRTGGNWSAQKTVQIFLRITFDPNGNDPSCLSCLSQKLRPPSQSRTYVDLEFTVESAAFHAARSRWAWTGCGSQETFLSRRISPQSLSST